MTRRRRGRRGEGDRGAVLLEFAVLSLVLTTLVFGVVEFGLAWQDRLTVQTAVRSGVRVGSNLGSTSTADYNLLQGVVSSINDVGLANVDYVVVYKSTASDGSPPTSCISPTPASQSGSCNVYTGAQLQALNASSFGCGSGKLDNAWCPTTRQDLQSAGTDYLGVWIRVHHHFITGVFGSSTTITDDAVMRIEPKG